MTQVIKSSSLFKAAKLHNSSDILTFPWCANKWKTTDMLCSPRLRPLQPFLVCLHSFRQLFFHSSRLECFLDISWAQFCVAFQVNSQQCLLQLILLLILHFSSANIYHVNYELPILEQKFLLPNCMTRYFVLPNFQYQVDQIILQHSSQFWNASSLLHSKTMHLNYRRKGFVKALTKIFVAIFLRVL